MLDTYLSQLDLCYFEITEAFKGLQDEHVWVRPAPALLSVGELAGHIAYWEAVRFGGDSEDGGSLRDLSNCKISSPLLDPRFGYYTKTVELAAREWLPTLKGEEVLREVTRVHDEAMVFLKARNPDLDNPAPHWHSSYAELLKYVAFHIAYHTGQMYSVRHLLGEETPDN